MARFASWRELLAAFAAANLPVIPLKGFVLSQYLYADPFRRLSSDFDLLIRWEDFAAADGLLKDLGCRRVKWHGPRAACEAGYARAGADPESAWNVDLHWDVVPRWHFLWRPFEGAWDQAVAWSWETGAAPPGEPANRRTNVPLTPHSSLLTLSGESANLQSANLRTGEPANGQSADLQKQQESSLRPLRLRGESSAPQSANLQTCEPANGHSVDLQKQQESSLRPLCLCGESSAPDLLTLSPSDTAWFALVNNVSDYGLGNLRGCVEALELLALLDDTEADRFRAMAREGRAGRALAALERFRARFFPGSAADAVARLAPARRLSAARHFADERLYLPAGANGRATAPSFKAAAQVSAGVVSAGASAGTTPAAASGVAPAHENLRNGSSLYRAPLSQRAAIRLALAGPGPRFAGFCAGKLYESIMIRACRLTN